MKQVYFPTFILVMTCASPCIGDGEWEPTEEPAPKGEGDAIVAGGRSSSCCLLYSSTRTHTHAWDDRARWSLLLLLALELHTHTHACVLNAMRGGSRLRLWWWWCRLSRS